MQINYNEHIQYTDMRSHFKFVWNFRIYNEIGKYFAKVLTLLWWLGLTQVINGLGDVFTKSWASLLYMQQYTT